MALVASAIMFSIFCDAATTVLLPWLLSSRYPPFSRLGALAAAWAASACFLIWEILSWLFGAAIGGSRLSLYLASALVYSLPHLSLVALTVGTSIGLLLFVASGLLRSRIRSPFRQTLVVLLLSVAYVITLILTLTVFDVF